MGDMRRSKRCPMCKGGTKALYTYTKCPNCKGTGKLKHSRRSDT